MVEFELKKKVEAILFSAGKYVSVKDIAKFAGRSVTEEQVLEALKELENDFKSSDSSMMILNERDMWKLTVRDAYMGVARKIVTQTDMSKTVMETLAVIAFKAPALQSNVIKVRTNKAYDHIRELEERGYITRKPEGRSKRISLTQKFFDYFDLPPEQLKQRFAKVKELQANVEYLEEAVSEKKKEAKEKQEAAKQREAEHKAEHAQSAEELERAIQEHPGIEVGDKVDEEKLLESYRSTETYTEQDSEDASPIKKDTEHFGKLEVVDEPPLNIEPPKGTGKKWGSLTVVKTEKKEEKEEGEKKEKKEDKLELGKTEPAIPGEVKEEKEPTTLTKEDVKAKELKETTGLYEKDMPEDVKAKIESRIEELLDPKKEYERKQKEEESRKAKLEGKKEEKAPSLDKEESKEKKEEKKEDKSKEKSEEKEEKKEEPKKEKEDKPKKEKDSDEISKAIKDVKND